MKRRKNKYLLNDEELIKAIKQTNCMCLFAELYKRHVDFVYFNCLKFTSSKEEAQDLAHDIFENILIKLKNYKQKSKFSTWLYAATHNYCMNHHTRNQNKINNSVEFIEVDEELALALYQKKLDELKTTKLKKAFSSINSKDKKLLTYKYQEGYTIRNLIETLNVNESAVKMRLKRAKAKVKLAYYVLN